MECGHTEHAIGEGGRIGRRFPKDGPDVGIWEPCDEGDRRDIYPFGFERWVQRILLDVGSPPNLSPGVHVIVERDRQIPNGRFYLQCVAPQRLNVDTSRTNEGKGGKSYLSPHVIESELVQTAFGLIKAYFEHEVREGFTYKGKRVFGPHIDIDAYLLIADRTVARPKT